MKPFPALPSFAAVVLLYESVCSPALQAAPPDAVDVLIRFRNAPGNNEANVVRKHGGNLKNTFRIVPAVSASLPAAAVENMKKEPGVEAVEVDGTMEAHEINNTWGVKRIGCGPVHDGTFAENAAPVKGSGVKVAIMDTGIDYTHPELISNFAGGYDFINNDADPRDDQGHGTHVAGTVGAFLDHAGVVGAAPEADLYAVKVLASNGSGSYSAIISGLEWCVDNGMAVANLSLGSSGDPGSTVKMAFDNAEAAGLLIVASAGNSGEGADTVGYPARYASVVAVASTTSSDQRSSFSSTGPAVEVAAPGSDIYSTLMGGGYGYKSGTSMAAPHVSGAAALVIAAGVADNDGDGKINDDARAILQITSDDLGAAGIDNSFGHGLVNAEFAVLLVFDSATLSPPQPTTVFEAPSSLSGTVAGNTVTLGWADNSNCEEGVQIQYGIKSKAVTKWYEWANVGADATGYSGAIGNGTYRFRIRAYKDSGASSTAWSNEIQLSVGSTGGGGKKNR